MGLALPKILFPSLWPGWMSKAWDAKRRASVWEASLGVELHLARSLGLALLELTPPAQKPSRS